MPIPLSVALVATLPPSRNLHCIFDLIVVQVTLSLHGDGKILEAI